MAAGIRGGSVEADWFRILYMSRGRAGPGRRRAQAGPVRSSCWAATTLSLLSRCRASAPRPRLHQSGTILEPASRSRPLSCRSLPLRAMPAIVPKP